MTMAMLQGFTNRRSGRLLALLFVAMIVALSVLGFLQYRWISEAGNATELQLRENLEVSTSGFQQDFEDQLRRITTAFRQSQSNRSDNDIARQFQLDYETWAAASPFARLLEQAFLMRSTVAGRTELFRMDTQAAGLQHVEWSAALSPLQDSFSRGGPDRLLTFLNAAAIPALVIPLTPLRGERGQMPPPRERGFGPPPRGGPPFGGAPRGGPPPPPQPTAWIVLRLNRDFFQSRF